MSRFKRCTRAAEQSLRAFFPDAKGAVAQMLGNVVSRGSHPINLPLSQASELLATALGHSTYASFKLHDRAMFDGVAAYAVLDRDAALLRAMAFELDMTLQHWEQLMYGAGRRTVVDELWLMSDIQQMGAAANSALQTWQDERIAAICHRYGKAECGRRPRAVTEVEGCQAFGGDFPKTVVVSAPAELYLQDVSIPVTFRFEFPKVGRRLFGEPQLISLDETGAPSPYVPEESLYDGGETY